MPPDRLRTMRACTGAVCAVGAVGMAAVLTACGLAHTASTTTSSTQGTLPIAAQVTLDSVTNGRFRSLSEVGDNALIIAPAHGAVASPLSAAQVRQMAQADDRLQGTYAFLVVGIGLATLRPGLPFDGVAAASSPGATTRTTRPRSTTTTRPPPTTTTRVATTTTTAPPATTTTAAPVTTTTAAPAATTTTRPPATTTTAAPTTTTTEPPTTTTTSPYATFQGTPAWIAVAVGGAPGCPGAGGTPRQTALVIDAATGRAVAAVTAPASCAAPAPGHVVKPAELESVTWNAVGPTSTAVRVTLPACATYYGWTQVDGPGGALLTQVVAAVPYMPTCPSPAPHIQVVEGVIPLGDPGAPHAHGGPVAAAEFLVEG